MPNKVLLKKSSVAAKVPLTTELDYGELALNYTDEKLYFKNASNIIKSFNVGSATPNDGQLTLAVSGVGLSGSATFTANQSTNSTFTVTSNATSANTASTIVARDASGNFSAGTITATLNGNAGTATAWQTARTLTIGNTGKNVDGSAAVGWSLAEIGAYAATNPSGYTTNTGTVTSVGGTGTVSGLTLTGTVTTTGNLTLGGTLSVAASNFASQTANTVLAAPNGAAGVPTFRAIVAADVPTLNQSTTGNAATATAWQTARTLTIGNTGKSVDGSAAVGWSLAEIGALPLAGGVLTGSIKINTTGSSSNASHFIIKRSGAAEPGSFGSYSGSWRSGIEIWNNDSTKMLFLNPPENDSSYANIKSVGGGFFVDVGSSGGTRAIQIESTGAANFPVGLAHNGNAVLTTGNYNSYSPTLTGTGASGTWGINVTGSASSSTNTVYQLSSDDRIKAPSDDDSNKMRFGFTSWNNNNTDPWADYLHLRSYGDSTGGSDNLIMFRKSGIGMRIWQQTFGSGTAYSTFKDVAWTDGTNSTGTWGINITGNAANITAYTINQSVGTGNAPTFADVYTNGWFRNNESGEGLYNQATAQHWYSDSASYWNMGGGVNGSGIRFRDNHAGTIRGYVYYDQSNNIGFLNQDGSWRARVVGGDYWLVEGSSARAQIFYDSNDTSYYIDAASTTGSRLSHLYVGNVAGSNDGGWNARLKVIGSSHARIDVVSNSDGIVTTMYSHTGQGVGRLGTTSNHPLILMAQSDAEGGQVYSGSLRSPIFYDSNDTTFYLDPNSSTTSIRTAGDWRSNSSAWSGEFSGKIQYHSNSWYFQASNLFIWRNSSGTDVVYSNQSGELTAVGNVRSPIFYDSNNTAYYVDPNSTTNINALGLDGSITKIGGYAPSQGAIRLTPNLHLNSMGGNAVIINWDNGTTGAVSTLRVGNGASSDVYYIRADGYSYQNGYAENAASFRAPIFYDSNNTSYYTDPASTSVLNYLQVGTHIEQGNNLGRPNVNWSASGTSTGMVIFYIPGVSPGNYGMLHMVFDIYEYVTGRTATVIIGGHNWSTSWYNIGCNVVGFTNKSIRLGVKDGRYCVVFGTSGSSWEYGTIVLRKVHNAGFYDNIVDMNGNWSTTQTTTESFTNVTGDLRELRTSNSLTAGGSIESGTDVRAPIFYDSNDTGYYIDPNSTSNSALRIRGGTLHGPNTSWGAYLYVGTNGNIDVNTATVAATNGNLHLDAANGYVMYLNNYATSSYTIANQSMRSPIFYDSNDTSYYIDSNSQSRINSLRTAGHVVIGGTFEATAHSNFTAARLMFSGGDADAQGNYYIGTNAENYGGNHNKLDLRWHTGIRMGAQPSYGGIRFYDTEDLGTQVFAIGKDGSFAQANQSMRAPIFYDLDNTSYYIDAASTSVLNRISTVRTNDWLYIDQNYGHSVVGVYDSYRLQGVFAMGDSYKLSADGTSAGNLYGLAWSHPNAGSLGGASNLNDHGLLIINNGSFRAALSSRAVFSADVRGTLFYDYNDTAYSLDPAGTSVLWRPSAATQQRWSISWRAMDASASRPQQTGDSDYWTTTVGWATTFGTWANYWKYGFGGFDCWGSSTDHPQGAGYVHAQGIQSGLHYANSDGSSAYGWQMVGAHAATDNRYWARGKWGGSISGWKEFAMYGGGGAGDLRASLFYDSDNTGYYTDPASTSNLNVLALQRAYAGYDAGVTGSFSCSAWFRSNGTTGWYNESYAGGINMEDTTWVRVYNSKAFYVNNQIAATGDVTSLYSDSRLKTNLGTIKGALQSVLKLSGFRYVNNELAKSFGYTSEKLQLGVSAQEVEALFPEIVSLAPFDMHTDAETGEITSKSGDNYKTVAYDKLVPVLIEAIKEQDDKISRLEALVEKLIENKT